jgi:plastocyanin
MGISGKTVLWSAVTGALLAALPPHVAARAGGTIVGTISTKEPARPPLKVSIDASVCGASLPDEAITVDGAGRVANAVVTVAGVKSPAPAEITIANEKCRFVPHVAVVRPAGTVKVTNRDPAPVLHTTHAQMTDGKFLFNVSLPIPNQTVTKQVDKSGTLQLVCNTHPWMRGWLFVTDELSAATGADGTFRLEGVPAGTRELRIWHEALKAAPVQVTVKDGETSTVAVTLVK